MENQQAVHMEAAQHGAIAAPPSETLTLYMNPAPYPKVTGEHNPETAALLKQDYAGVVSELTAVMQYLFQHTICMQSDPAFANAMLAVARAEMSHLDLLGGAIHALGGSARFGDGRHYWQASVVNYADTPEAMLLANIDSESAAIANYEQHASMTDNESVSALLLRISEDEKLHLRFFRETLGRIRADSQYTGSRP